MQLEIELEWYEGKEKESIQLAQNVIRSWYGIKFKKGNPYQSSPSGVAIGLAAMVFNQFMSLGMNNQGSLIINVVGLGVILSELGGPILVRKGLIRSGEVKNQNERYLH